MAENDQESFFMSESLKDILDKDDLLQAAIEEKAKSGNETVLLGKFSKLSLLDETLTVVTDQKTAKLLLQSPLTDFTYQFMDETWVLSASKLSVKQLSNDFEITLAITGRR